MSGKTEADERRERREQTKAYLNRVRNMETERQTLMEYREITRAWLEGAGADQSREKVDESGDPHSMEKLFELDEEIEKRCRELLAEAENIQEIIQAVPSSQHRTILMSRFLLGESPETTMSRVFMSRRSYFYHLGAAIDEAYQAVKEKDCIDLHSKT